MDNQNPWQSEASQGTPYRSNTSQQQQTSYNQSDQWQQQQQPQSQSYGWSNPNAADTHSQSNTNPWGGTESQNTPSSFQSYQPPQPQGQQHNQYQAPPNPPPRRTDSDMAALLASQPDSGEQLEHMQNYEANKQLTQDERNQAELQKQFPSIDSSLIAAIYSDHKDQRGGQVDLASIRETLQELQS